MSMHKLLPYQSKWIHDNSKIKLIEKSRQIGISWATAYSLVRQHSLKSNTLDSWVSSSNTTQAKLFLQDCTKFANALNPAAHALGSSLLHHKNKSTQLSLPFANNSHIHCISSSPDAQAGKRGSRILDEFALHPDPEKLYTTAYPGITWGGSLQIISTHRSQNNFFNTLIKDITLNNNLKNISHHKVTLEDALNQGFLTQLKLKLPKNDPIQSMSNDSYFDYIKNSCPDNEAFLQEYMCIPTDTSSFFIDPQLIDACINNHPTPSEPGELYLGVDLARSNDLSVFYLIEKINNQFYTRDIHTFKDTPFDTQAQFLEQLLSLPNLKHATIDQSGLGLQFTETAIKKFSKSRVSGLQFTQKSKELLAYTLKRTLQNQQIQLPNNKNLIHDLRAIRRTTSPSGNTKFDAPRTKQGHADRFWALTLALHAAQHNPHTPLHYLPIHNHSIIK